MGDLSSNARSRGRCDIAVVGAGSSGFAAAIAAAEAGAQVALIGHGTLGGTCVNVGCVPSKTLIRAMEGLHAVRAAARFAGIDGAGRLADWAALVRQKDELVAQLRQAKYAGLLRQYPSIRYLEGSARIVDGGVRVDGELVSAPRTVVATGARPHVPAIPGIEGVDVLTSDAALSLPALPRSLLVVGGGYIGCELAQLFARAGVAVTLACRSRLLPGAEPEITDGLAGYLRAEGLRLHGGVVYRRVAGAPDGVALTVAAGGQEQVLRAERMLVATGRRPNTERLGLAAAGIAQDERGAIRVDDRMRTTRPGTYAAGDVTGRDQFVYMAAYGAGIAARNALNGDSLVYDNAAMPSVVFTDPQVAAVGLTEAAARAAGHAVRTSVLPLDQLPRALAARDTRGLVKLVAEVGTMRLLGAHILAPEGADSIQTASLAIRQGLTVDALAGMIFPYLTTVEGLKLAAQAFHRDIERLSCCAG